MIALQTNVTVVNGYLGRFTCNTKHIYLLSVSLL